MDAFAIAITATNIATELGYAYAKDPKQGEWHRKWCDSQDRARAIANCAAEYESRSEWNIFVDDASHTYLDVCDELARTLLIAFIRGHDVNAKDEVDQALTH